MKPINYNALAQGLLGNVFLPVADNPFARRNAVHPLMGLEGAGGPRQGGGGGRAFELTPTAKISEAGPYSGMPRGTWSGRKELRIDGKTKAFAEIIMSPNTGLRIQHIETSPGSRRMGYASKIVESLKHEFPNTPLSTSMRTKDGAALFKKLGIE